jgi:hypothetical protein
MRHVLKNFGPQSFFLFDPYLLRFWHVGPPLHLFCIIIIKFYKEREKISEKWWRRERERSNDQILGAKKPNLVLLNSFFMRNAIRMFLSFYIIEKHKSRLIKNCLGFILCFWTNLIVFWVKKLIYRDSKGVY